MPIKEKRTGFVLLYAVIITTVVFAVGMSLINIITKQLIISSVSKSGKTAYYAALSGKKCAEYWKSRPDGDAFGAYPDLPSYSSIICGGELVNLDKTITGKTSFQFDVSDSSSARVEVFYDDRCEPAIRIKSIGYNTTKDKIGSFNARRVSNLYQDQYKCR